MPFQIHTIPEPKTIYFEETIKNGLNSKTIKKKLSELQWIDSTVGNSKTGENIVDQTIRNSFKGKKSMVIEFDYNENHRVLLDNFFPDFKFEFKFDFNNEGDYIDWEAIRYTSGGFFARHIDGKKDSSHYGTAIIIPPINFNLLKMELTSEPLYTGGELIVDDLEILADDSWKLILISIDTPHELKPVLSGERIIFKSRMTFTLDMKYLMDAKTFNTPIECNYKKILHKIDTEINELKEKIVKLEEERQSIVSGDLHENDFIKEIKGDKNKKKTYYSKSWTNQFIVLLYNHYSIPTPDSFSDEDRYTYNLLLKHFPDATIRIMNIGGQINRGDTGSSYSVSFSKETENIRETNEDERHYKFENLSVYQNFDDGVIPGNNVNSDSVYNDQTYDNIEICDFTVLHVQV
jgi:hypothetical protein